MATPIKNRASFEGMLAEEANYIPGCQPRHVRFMDTMKDQIASTLHNLQEEVVLPSDQFQKATKKKLDSTQLQENLERCRSQNQ